MKEIRLNANSDSPPQLLPLSCSPPVLAAPHRLRGGFFLSPPQLEYQTNSVPFLVRARSRFEFISADLRGRTNEGRKSAATAHTSQEFLRALPSPAGWLGTCCTIGDAIYCIYFLLYFQTTAAGITSRDPSTFCRWYGRLKMWVHFGISDFREVPVQIKSVGGGEVTKNSDSTIDI